MNRAIAVLALAAALLMAGARPGSGRLRALTAPSAPADQGVVRPLPLAVGAAAAGALAWAAVGGIVATVAAALLVTGAGLLAPRWRRLAHPPDDPLDLAAAWVQLAVCLEVGLPVAAAVAAAAEPLTGRAGAELRRTAGLLELGADPVQAWHAAHDLPALAGFARAAVRSAGTGAALARAARAEGTRLRAALADATEARVQRATVLIAAPLGLCFLPAFVVLGIAPVVVGLARQALAGW
jgi:Type II secretion system (T2SS), protein F